MTKLKNYNFTGTKTYLIERKNSSKGSIACSLYFTYFISLSNLYEISKRK